MNFDILYEVVMRDVYLK
jgi:hypothetical protein